MLTIFHIAKWEFITRFKTKSFLFSTFVLPLVFSLLITLPIYFLTYENEISTKLIGLINSSGITIADDLQKKEYSVHAPAKKIVIIQSLDIGQVWNITFLTKTFKTLNVKIDSQDGSISAHGLIDFFKVES